MTSDARFTAQADDFAVVRLSGVGVRYGDNQVLEGVDLALHPGTITALSARMAPQVDAHRSRLRGERRLHR